MTPNAAATKLDFSERRFVVIWKTTPASDLVCVDWRAFAPSLRSPLELSTTESQVRIGEIVRMQRRPEAAIACLLIARVVEGP